MVDTATAKYLNDNIGPVLAKGLAEMATVQPTDGIDFLSKWLKAHAEQEEVKAWREKEASILEEERSKVRKVQADTQAKVDRRNAESAATQKAYDTMIAKLNNPDTIFDDEIWAELVDVARRFSGCKSAYLGVYDEEGLDGREGGPPATGPVIRYDYATTGSEWMCEKVLPKDSGVTYGVFKESPDDETIKSACLWKPPAPPKSEDDEAEEAAPPVEGQEVPDDGTKLPNYPVLIDCVTDNDAVQFFDMTRLGAYLAVPLIYPSYYGEEALSGAKAHEAEAKEAMRVYTEAKEAADAAAAELAEKGEEPPEGEEVPTEELLPPEPKELVLTGKNQQLVLCMDTLGTNAKIPEDKVMPLLELCKACGECKARTESKQVAAQAKQALDTEARDQLLEQIAEVRQEKVTEFEEALNNELAALNEEGLEDEAKALATDRLNHKYTYLRNKATLLEFQENVINLRSWVVVPQEMINALAATALMFGYKNEAIYPKRKPTLKWEKLKTILDDILFSAIQKIEVEGERENLAPEQKLSSIEKVLPVEYDVEKMTEISASFEVFLAFITSAIIFRRADVNYRKAEIEKAMKAAEEEGAEPYKGPTLAEADADFTD